jgi:hypothetical protein
MAYQGWNKQQSPMSPISSRRSLKVSRNIQLTVKSRTLVDDSDASPSSAGAASGSAMKALMIRPMMQEAQSTPAKAITKTSLLTQLSRFRFKFERTWPAANTAEAAAPPTEDMESLAQRRILSTCLANA